MAEALEARALLADGISPAPGPPLSGVAGVPITDAVFATFTVSDPSGEPGTQWRALINFGDGQKDGPVIPVQKGDEFEFVDTHTYRAPGTYTITVMIAVPGSGKPNDNTVTTTATVTASTPTPTPTPTPLQAFGESRTARVDRTFHKEVARSREPHTTPGDFTVTIDWGDNSGLTAGQVRRRGKGRYAVVGSHRYATPGVFAVTVTIRDAAGEEIAAHSSVNVSR